MLPIHYADTPQTPPSSPPSSPYPTSSSPPSSPSLDPLALDSDGDGEEDTDDVLGRRYASSSSVESFGVGHGHGHGHEYRYRYRYRHRSYGSYGEAPMDPLAAAYGYRRAKRASGVACSPGQTPMKKRARFRSRSPMAGDEDEDGDGDHKTMMARKEMEMTPEERERNRQKELWERVVEHAWTTGDRKIDLTDMNIDEVPPSAIKDLANLVVLPRTNEPEPGPSSVADDILTGVAASTMGPAAAARSVFGRTHTAPATTTAGWGRLGPKALSTNSVLGASREAMDLFLGKNNIARLPMELWNLHNLTVLSLRNNCLTYIPPEIANLRDLQTLNLAHNKLRYIPSELLQMKTLKTLNLFPNPFLPKPPPNRAGKYVSKTERKGARIPPLTELALRVMLARRKGARETVLEQYYELPLGTLQDQRPITTFRDILSVCVPASVLPDQKLDSAARTERLRRELQEERGVTGTGICPNPGHDESSTFIRPSEERYTWVEKIAWIKDNLGGHAAVLWRGCSWGCLDFLGVAGEEEVVGEKKDDKDENMDVDLQESEEVVQTVRFEAGTMLDFDE